MTEEEPVVPETDGSVGDPVDSPLPQLPQSLLIPGPNAAGAFVWAFAVVGIHILGSVVTAIVVLVCQMVQSGGGDANRLLERLNSDDIVVMYGGEMLIFVVFTVLAVGCKYRRNTGRHLGLTSLSARHTFLILCLCLPLSLACGRLHSWTVQIWEQIAPLVPYSGEFEKFQTMEVVKTLAESTSLPILLLILAAAPALGEELIFRGIIGRGLVARWGAPAGIFGTALLFAMVHLHPAHAVALIPLAILIHLVYLATRSFWAPVLLHFLNNGLAAVLLKTTDSVSTGKLADEASLPLDVTMAAAVSVCGLGMLIWQTRVQYLLPDGTKWTPGYETVEEPPSHIKTVKAMGKAKRGTVLFAVISLISFFVLLASAMWTG